MQKISIVTPGYNEESNVVELCRRIKDVMHQLPEYDYEHIFIDNASTDETVAKLKAIAAEDRHLKIIVNSRNFGHIRSPYHGILQATGDAVIMLASDLQDPPEMILDFVERWKSGFLIAIASKTTSEENGIMFAVRKAYYRLLARVSETSQVENFTGFGLYDKKVVDQLRRFKDPYPFFRGLIAEVGFQRAVIPFKQPKRKKGKTKNNFFTLYDIGMLGFVNYSKLPLRLSAFIGFLVGTVSFFVALAYLIYKLVFWENFQVGMAPVVIGLFFFSSVQLFFLGIVGEYVGAIYTQVKDRPLVIENERINFDG